jgi:hypothetical protein
MIPPFNFSNASSAMLKPAPAVSMAVMMIHMRVAGLVMFQHPPQLGESQTTSKAPPMKGNVGRSPNVGNFATRPVAPFEHATLLREPFLLSNVVSNVTRRGEGVGRIGPGRVGVGDLAGAGEDGDKTEGSGRDEDEMTGGREDGDETEGIGRDEDEMTGGREDGGETEGIGRDEDEMTGGREDGDDMEGSGRDGDAIGPLGDKTEGLGIVIDAGVVKTIDMVDDRGPAELGDAGDMIELPTPEAI